MPETESEDNIHSELAEVDSAREIIIRNYDNGGKDDVNIEETEFDIHYIHYDRYGFVHDIRLNENPRQSASEKKWMEKEKSREEKWIIMITDVKKWFTANDGDKFYQKMTDRVWKGVPDKIRGTVWRILLNVDIIKQKQQGIYNKMRSLGRQTSPHIQQIDLDVRRTFRRHVMFRERYCPSQTDLFTILTAHSVYNRQVGYCQGMSQIAAVLLMYINCDEDTFIAFGQLLLSSKYNMNAFFLPTFPKLDIFQKQLEKILNIKLSKLHTHLKQQNTDTKIYSVRWFLQIFVNSLPFSLTLRVWDLFLLCGDSILLAMAYNILKLHSKTLIKMDMDSIGEFFQKTLPSSFGYEDDFVIESLRESVDELNSIQMNTTEIPKSSSQNLGDKSSQVQKSQTDSVPIVKVKQTKDVINDDSDDEPIITADADLTVIIEEPDESIVSSKSICSSRDDLSSSLDYYEDMMLIETDHINTPVSTFSVNRHRLPLRDVVDKRDIMMFQFKLRLLFERKLDEKEKNKTKVNFVKRVRIQNIDAPDHKDMPKRLEADIIIECQT